MMTPRERAREAVREAVRQGFIVGVDTCDRAYAILRDDREAWREVPRAVLEVSGRL